VLLAKNTAPIEDAGTLFCTAVGRRSSEGNGSGIEE
jgi:hypothetical protein